MPRIACRSRTVPGRLNASLDDTSVLVLEARTYRSPVLVASSPRPVLEQVRGYLRRRRHSSVSALYGSPTPAGSVDTDPAPRRPGISSASIPAILIV